MLDRVIQENTDSQQECDTILQDIAEDEDSDLALGSGGNESGGGSGRKRRRSLVMDEEDEDVLGSLSPVAKKARHSGARRKEQSTTPFKAGKGMYQPRKQRNKKNISNSEKG